MQDEVVIIQRVSTQHHAIYMLLSLSRLTRAFDGNSI